jgi:hypothetical protein
MTETGWPLIPREVLPAPVPAAKRRQQQQRPSPQSPEAGRQLPIFGAETTEPSPGDLVGLLAGPGRLGRMGGTARVSVPVDAAWRVHVLVAELVGRGLVVNWRPLDTSPPKPGEEEGESNDEGESEDEGESGRESEEAAESEEVGESDIPAEAAETTDPTEPADEEVPTPEKDDSPADESQITAAIARPRFEVLTAYSRRLNGLARAWPEAAAELFLSGPRLRLWVAAAGEPVAGGYALGLDPEKDPTEIDAALVRAGLAGRVSKDGLQYLILGKRRVARLAELVGERPVAAPEEQWPRGAGA